MYNSYKTYPAVLFLGEYFKICEVFIYMISRKIMAPFSLGSIFVSSVDGQHIIVGNKFLVMLVGQVNQFLAFWTYMSKATCSHLQRPTSPAKQMFVVKVFTCVGSTAS